MKKKKRILSAYISEFAIVLTQSLGDSAKMSNLNVELALRIQ